MQIEIKIDRDVTEPKIIIVTNRMTDEVSELIKKLSLESSQIIAGFQNSEIVLLEQADIIRIYAAGGKVYATTQKR